MLIIPGDEVPNTVGPSEQFDQLIEVDLPVLVLIHLGYHLGDFLLRELHPPGLGENVTELRAGDLSTTVSVEYLERIIIKIIFLTR